MFNDLLGKVELALQHKNENTTILQVIVCKSVAKNSPPMVSITQDRFCTFGGSTTVLCPGV